MTGRVRVERDGAIGWLIFDQIERRNAINTAMWDAIPAAVGELDGDPDVRVIVMRGAGDVAFVSGADISEFGEARNADRAAEYAALNGRAFASLAGVAKPLVAMVHGFCVGGGTAIALNADLRYAADDAQFGIPAARLGLGYEAEGIECLARLVGTSTAAEMLFTARRYGAEEALRVGLVNAVMPKAELETFVRDVATTIAANAPLSLRSAKLVLRELGRSSRIARCSARRRRPFRPASPARTIERACRHSSKSARRNSRAYSDHWLDRGWIGRVSSRSRGRDVGTQPANGGPDRMRATSFRALRLGRLFENRCVRRRP